MRSIFGGQTGLDSSQVDVHEEKLGLNQCQSKPVFFKRLGKESEKDGSLDLVECLKLD